ncbi:hypothetical protein Tco_0374868, partial [Tanacetum coccineum]
GVGLLLGKGPRVIVSADVSILLQSVFVRGGTTGAAFKEVKGSIITPYKAGGPFLSLVEPEAASLPLVGVGLSKSQPPSYTVEDVVLHFTLLEWQLVRTTTNGDLEDEATPSGEQSSPLVPKTAKQLAARRNQERIKSILLLAIPDEYLLKFHNVPDANSLWAAIKSRFGEHDHETITDINELICDLYTYLGFMIGRKGGYVECQSIEVIPRTGTNLDFKIWKDQGRRPYGDMARVQCTINWNLHLKALVAHDGLEAMTEQ